MQNKNQTDSDMTHEWRLKLSLHSVTLLESNLLQATFSDVKIWIRSEQLKVGEFAKYTK